MAGVNHSEWSTTCSPLGSKLMLCSWCCARVAERTSSLLPRCINCKEPLRILLADASILAINCGGNMMLSFNVGQDHFRVGLEFQPRRRGRNAYCEVCCDSAVKLVKQERDTAEHRSQNVNEFFASRTEEQQHGWRWHVAVAPAQTTCPCTSKDGKLWNIDVVVK